METGPIDTPSEVRVQDGEVRFYGPGGLSFAFTPMAALQTGERLIQAGVRAQVQGRK